MGKKGLCLLRLCIVPTAAANTSTVTGMPIYSNGHAKNGKRRYQCQDCKKYGRQDPGSNAYDEKTKALILAAYRERPSLRGLRRVFGVSRNTVSAWLKKSQSPAAP